MMPNVPESQQSASAGAPQIPGRPLRRPPPPARGQRVMHKLKAVLDRLEAIPLHQWLKGLGIVLLVVVPLHYFRFVPLVNNGAPIVWDRLEHQFCGVQPSRPGHIFCP